MILGLMGGAGAGKTTIAKYLVSRYDAKEFTFAHPLKRLVRQTFVLPKEAVYGSQYEKETPRAEARGYSGRTLMQMVGQGAREAWGKSFWVDMTLRQIQDEGPKLAVLSDVRYINEAESIRNSYDKLSFVIKIVNPNRKTTADSSHPSESEWEHAKFDYVIDNDGKDLTALHAKIDGLCRKLIIFPKRESLSF